jgi:cytochrome P450
MDPPKHDRFRKLVSAGFTRRQIQRLIEQIDHHAKEIVDDIAERGEVEFVDAVSSRLPIAMICEMLGIPEADWGQMRDWSDKMVGWDDPELAVTPETQLTAAAEMFGYCDELVKRRQTDPGDDILSTLVHAEVDGDRLNPLELDLFFVTLVIAGNETTRNLISHGMLALFDHPDQAAKLRANPDLMPTAVDEMLRWGSSIQNFRRTATRDTEVRGVPVQGPEGRHVLPVGQLRRGPCSATRSPSGSTGRPTTTSRSAVVVSTSASARTSPRPRSGRSSGRSCSGCRTSTPPATPSGCGRTSSTGSSGCRSSSRRSVPPSASGEIGSQA